MGHDQVTAPGFGFPDNVFGGIQTADDPGTIPTRTAGDQACIIVGLLERRRCPGFQKRNDSGYFHSGKLQQSVKLYTAGKAYAGNSKTLVPFTSLLPSEQLPHCFFNFKLPAMLRRTTGRLLLLLLVITGSAGTIVNNSITKADRKYALNLMKESHKDVVKATKGLSEAQLDFKAAPDRWSVKECVFHIAASEKMLWGMFEKAMNAAPNPEKERRSR